jgi:hypothetical protein
MALERLIERTSDSRALTALKQALATLDAER